MDEEKIVPRWKIWEGMGAIAGIVVAMIGVGFWGQVLIPAWGIDQFLFIFLGTVLQNFLLIGLPWYIAVFRHRHTPVELGFLKQGLVDALPTGLKWGILLFFLVTALGLLVTALYPREPELQDFAKILLMVHSPEQFWLVVIMGVILAPLGEEVYFRGFLYPVLRHRWGVARGMILTTLFFSALHFDLYRFVPIAVGGLGLTYLYEKTGNIWTNVVAHGVWNGIMIALLFAYPAAR